MTSLVSDELLRSLMAVGEVDVLVGLPTLNHADTVGGCVRAVQVAFHRELAREDLEGRVEVSHQFLTR